MMLEVFSPLCCTSPSRIPLPVIPFNPSISRASFQVQIKAVLCAGVSSGCKRRSPFQSFGPLTFPPFFLIFFARGGHA